MRYQHTSVLLEEVLAGLKIRPDGIYLDGTLGGGGHSYHIAERLTAGGHVIGIDQDPAAIQAATERLQPFKERITLVRDNYENAPVVLRNLGYSGVDGILLDLGVSSYQLDTEERGFSYKTDAPLDMRMDPDSHVSAGDIVNNSSAEELTRILKEYGEERYAAAIAGRIVRKRQETPICTTGELAELIYEAIPAKARREGGNPCKRTFQAIRIACNRELEVLTDSLDAFIDMLNPGGRLCIISFHSLEDRIVKNAFKRNEHPCTCPPEFPMCVCGKKPTGFCVNTKPILPSEKEKEENKRAASAKLRIFEKAD